MEEDVPQRLKMVAVAQIVSGVINIFGGWWLSSCVIGNFCGIFTLYMGGQFCGVVSCLLLPLGLVEVGAGVFVLMQPREGAGVARIVSYVEMASVIGGGLVGLVTGLAVQLLMRDTAVVAYLEDE